MSDHKSFIAKSPYRYRGLIGLAVLCLTLLLIVSWSLKPVIAAPLQVGIGTGGLNAFELIGRTDQNNLDFSGVGYLTYIKGLNNAQIYSNPLDPSEDTARFTYVADATLTSRAVLSDVFVIDAQGTMTIYFTPSPPNRSFNNAASFASGTPIATTSVRYQDILLVQSPNKGNATGVSEVTELSASAFTLNGQSYQFGQPGLLYRLSTVGNGTRTNLNPPISFVLLAGNAITSGGEQSFLPSLYRDSH
ncbi:MAG: hypothetical protein KDI02_21995 [Anaerolineae bacterium]|nr:hypothetical protein [Anaerolineae bacterium]MCB0226380.1 hypothetical protein [Anaerolineae bacterium]